MASILNTDLGDLYSQWGERVAFNEGFQAQKIWESLSTFDDRSEFYSSRGLVAEVY